MLRAGQTIMLCVIALLLVGVVMVNSAGMSVDPIEPTGSAAPAPGAGALGAVLEGILLSRSVLYMVLGLVAICLVGLMPVHRLAARAERSAGSGRLAGLVPLALGVVALLAIMATVYLPGLEREVNGSRRWVALPLPGLRRISVQPSEMGKWGLVLLLAWYGSARSGLMPSFRHGLVPGLAAVGAVAGFVVLEDLGTGVLMALVGCLMLAGAGARIRHFLAFIPPALALVTLAIVTSPYRVQRLVAFLDPYRDPMGSGYHMIQSMAAVAGGEGVGRGLGNGLQKFGYLPEQQTDFVFAVTCEELGVAGAGLIIGLYAALLAACALIVHRERSPLLKLAGLGVMGTLGLQAVINLIVVTGLGPTKGIALPLVSSGGTGWILTAASLGLLVAMDREAPQALTIGSEELTTAAETAPSGTREHISGVLPA